LVPRVQLSRRNPLTRRSLWSLLAAPARSRHAGNGNGSSLATAGGAPRQLSQAIRPLPAEPVRQPTPDNLNNRYATVLKHFPSALGVDDFIARVEVALCYFGFTGANTIGESGWGVWRGRGRARAARGCACRR
jgi:hypothetical protein